MVERGVEVFVFVVVAVVAPLGSRGWKWDRNMRERAGQIYLGGMRVTSVALPYSFYLASFTAMLTSVLRGCG